MARLPYFYIDQEIYRDMTPLMTEAYYGKIEVIRELAKLFPNLDVNVRKKYGSSALSYAVEEGQPAVIKELVALFPNIDPNTRDHENATPLIYVAYANKRQLEVIQELARIPNFDVNAQNTTGNNALIYATKEGKIEIILELAKIPNINPRLKNKNGKTALNFAINEATRQCLIRAFL
jgi:ankyrin repeat protein